MLNIEVTVYYRICFNFYIRAWWISKPRIEKDNIIFKKPLSKRYYVESYYVWRD